MSQLQALVEIVKEKLNSEDFQLPVFHPLCIRLQSLLSSPDYSIDEIVTLIMKDQAIAGRVLKVANSPLYAGRKSISTVKDASVRLGAQEISDIALLASQQGNYTAARPIIRQLMNSLWQHAMTCAVGAKLIAAKSNQRELANEAFMAGLFHDIGKLLVLRALDELGVSNGEIGALGEDQIIRILDSLHVNAGCFLMKKWNMPEIFQTVVRDHHRKDLEVKSLTLRIVCVANMICVKLGVGFRHDPSLMPGAGEDAQALGISERALAEVEFKLEEAMAPRG